MAATAMTRLFGGTGEFNLLHGGAGDDIIVAAAQSNYILADAGADKITGTASTIGDHLSFDRRDRGV